MAELCFPVTQLHAFYELVGDTSFSVLKKQNVDKKVKDNLQRYVFYEILLYYNKKDMKRKARRVN